MRTKDEILRQSTAVMGKLPKEGRLMVQHEHLFLEVWIDLRDIIRESGKDLQEAIWNMPAKD